MSTEFVKSMFFEMINDLLDLIESDYFCFDNMKQWKKNLKKLGVKKEDEMFLLDLISKVVQLKALVCRARPKGGFPTRFYHSDELDRLNPACRGVLLHYEQIGLLPPELREIVIEQAMKLPDWELDEVKLRVLILFVLFHHQSGLDKMLEYYQTLPWLGEITVH